ncbi:MAG: hypothetical protein ACTSYT_01150 [Candidatus Asgardarchaeia archaeon]
MMSLKTCPRCGSSNIQMISKMPYTNYVEYTYKCLRCQHVWRERVKL